MLEMRQRIRSMKSIKLSKTNLALGLCLFLTSQPTLFADEVKSEDFPPVEHASFHQLVFADEDIAILNNFYPPGGDSGFHAHYRDLFYVVIQHSGSSGQGLGKPMTVVQGTPAGAAAFSPIGDQPRVHRVVNGDAGTSQFIVIELRRANPLGTEISSRETEILYTLIADNPRLRAWRLILEPGQSASSITQGGKGVRVVVRGGLLTTITPGLADQILALQPGDFAIQPVGAIRALKNIGTETIELVEMELK
jgi:mannose-6-phosphate isomerase-like protein (cupin superfamily)